MLSFDVRLMDDNEARGEVHGGWKWFIIVLIVTVTNKHERLFAINYETQ